MGLHRKLWLVVIGIPLSIICLIGFLACLLHWEWLEDKMIRWYEDIHFNS